MPAIRERVNAFSFLRKHPVFFVVAMLATCVLVLVLIAAYSSPPQTVAVDPKRRKPSGPFPVAEAAPVIGAVPAAAPALVIPGISRRTEGIICAILAVLGITLSVTILRIFGGL